MVTKKTLGIIGTSTLLVGGVSAYILLDKTPKEAYLYAEYKTGKEMVEFFADRYEPELSWSEKTKNNATKNDYELSANIEDYTYSFSPEIVDAINSSSLNLAYESDPKEKQVALGLGATVFDYDMDNFTFYITDESSMLELPFQDEVLKLSHEDLIDIIEEENGEICFNGEDLVNIFTNQSVLSEDDTNYLLKEYGKLLVDVLPDEAFTRNDNTITMKLSSVDIKDIISKVADFAGSDAELVRILEKTVHYSDPCGDINIEEELEKFLADLKNTDVNFDVVSTIWLDKNMITKRSIEIDGVKIDAEHSINNDLVFDYEFIDEYDETLLAVKGKFTSGKNMNDTVTIESSDVILTYESNESLEKEKRKFEREFYLSDYYSEFTINWDGHNTISGDKMAGEHNVYMEIPETGKFDLAIKNNSVITKKINVPSNTKDIGKMTMSEIEEYIEYEIVPNAEKWGEGLFEELADLLYY